MLYLTFTMISSVDIAHFGLSQLKIGYLWIVVQVVQLDIVAQLEMPQKVSFFGSVI